MATANLSGLAALLMTGKADQRLLDPAEAKAPDYEGQRRRIRRESQMEERVRRMDVSDLVGEMIAFEDMKARISEIADDFHPDSDREAAQALQEMRDALSALVS